ncbi:MAG TPA: rod shape-determining protein MreC [Candidatus Woesebacteria bacterium]|nr:rod shape-determining protein MreC [Candidatus Woesebacteria bacterium]
MLSEKNKQYILAFLLVFVLFFLQFLDFLHFAFLTNLANAWKEKNFYFLQKIAYPFHRVGMMWNLTAKLEDLQYRYNEAAANSIKIETLEKENQELRKILENSDRNYEQTVIAAPVISFAQSFVAAGSQAGVKAGSAVLYKGTLLGLIEQVFEKQALVLLLPQMIDTGILAQTSTEVKGLVKGNGRQILFTEIAADAKIEIGELVFTSSQVGLEKGLLIGRIASILSDNQALATKTAVVEQLVNFYEVSLVEIK